ncbi:MAG: hypothetical protein ACTS27_01275 [Phycisphaerales bacterium]
MGSLTIEHWVVLGLTAAAGIIGALYGISCILQREIELARLRRRAREVMQAHERRLAAIARGEIEAALGGEELTLPIDHR